MKGLMVLVFAGIILISKAQTKEARIVCYYTDWSVYYKVTKFSPNDINPFLCTHLIYAFGTFMNESGLAPFDAGEDITNGGYIRFTGLKSYNKKLKTLLSIGGWNEGSRRFSSIAADQDRRVTFAKNAILYLREHNFDGLDLDWIYPAQRDGSRPEDKENCVTLVKVLLEEFENEANATGRSRLLLSMAVPVDTNVIDKGFDIRSLNKYLDWMNIVSFEYHSAYEPMVNHHAALYAVKNEKEQKKNVNYTVNYYLKAGADSQKIVLGIPTYGRTFTLTDPNFTNVGAPAEGPGEPGESTRQKGNLAYFEICKNLMLETWITNKTNTVDDEYGDEMEGWSIVRSDVMGPYVFKGNQWISFDDINIVKKKAEYVADNSLGGIMIWSVDTDDFLGRCHGTKFPLIEAAKSTLYKKLGMDMSENTSLKATESFDVGTTTDSRYSISDSNDNIVVTTPILNSTASKSEGSNTFLLLILTQFDKVVIKKTNNATVLNVEIKK